MRNLIIAAAVIAGLVLAGIGAKYGWDLLRHPVVDADIDAHMKNGKMDGPMRESFLKAFVASCSSQVPAGIDEEKFKKACVCISEKEADLLTADDARAMNDTGKTPMGLDAQMQEPMRECARAAGLQPAQ